MKSVIHSVLVIALVACCANSTPAAEQPTQAVIQQIVEQVKPSLVRIHVVLGYPDQGRESKSESYGSGVIISPEGYVVTNHHVAGDARWLSCTLSNKEQVEAKLIGTDALSDIAVIKLASSPSGPYSAAKWGDSSRLRVGDPVLAMGSPLAFSQSVTAGIVSNTELVMPESVGDAFTLDGEDVGSIVRWIGHDADIHPGNSGGPLVNLNGEIVGINEIQLGLSGSITGNLAHEVSAQLIATGRVVRAFTGLDLQPRLRRDTHDSGVMVSGVVPHSPAAVAGVKPGDLLLAAGATKLDAKFPEQLPLINLELAHLPVGQPVEWTLLRDGQEVKVTVTARARDLAQARSHEIKGWGITGSDITPLMAQEYRYPSADGVLVTSVSTSGPAGAAKPPIEESDVILSVGGKLITSLTKLQDITALVPRRPDGVPTLVELWREGERLLTVVNINKENEEDTSVEVAKPWLPVNTQVLTKPLVTALHLPANTQGVRITQVHPHSVAETAGLKVGDVIIKLDGLAVEASQPEDSEVFSDMIRQYKIGTPVKLSLVRDGKPLTITVKLPQSPKPERELTTYHDANFGLTIRSVTYWDRVRLQEDPNATGAMVVDVDKGSWAALANLSAGDIIQRIDETPVTNMESARSKLRSLEQERPKRAVFFVSRGVHTLFVEVQTDWSLPPAPKVKPDKMKSPGK
ncbi:MAG: PDZ domain-containing protein [Armatimonadota bacterium]|nr:PDZ domain-containing protein [Armatimonadota bacterium]